MKAGVICWALVCVAIILLSAFLCWLFHNGWGVLVLLLLPRFRSDDSEDAS